MAQKIRTHLWVQHQERTYRYSRVKKILATESEGIVRRKYSDDDITVIRPIITPPRISPSAANRINCDVRSLYPKQYMKKIRSI